MRDVPGYLSEKIGRLLIKLDIRKQKKFEHLNHPDFYPFVRTMGILGESAKLLKDAGIINRDIEIQQLENGHLGKLLTLGLLVEHIEKHK